MKAQPENSASQAHALPWLTVRDPEELTVGYSRFIIKNSSITVMDMLLYARCCPGTWHPGWPMWVTQPLGTKPSKAFLTNLPQTEK